MEQQDYQLRPEQTQKAALANEAAFSVPVTI